MTGARLEVAGQVRNTYPFTTYMQIDVTISIPSAVIKDYPVVIPFTEQLPFDTGPDKSGRVFPVFLNPSFFVTADNTGGSLLAIASYQPSDGRKHHIGGISLPTISSTTNLVSYDRIIAPQTSFNVTSLVSLGNFVITPITISLGTATFIAIRLIANLGLYGDYSEPDWNTLFQMQQHEHSGLPIGSDYVAYEDSIR